MPLDLSPIFFSKIFVYFDKKDWPAQLNLPWPEEGDVGQCFEVDKNIHIVIKPYEELEQTVNTMAHESYHAVVKLMDFIGDESPSEEMTAILVGIITGYLFKEYSLNG
jgi:hypothetical protein